MNDKELKSLSRKELLELLLTQVKENDILRKRLDDAEVELQSRKIAIDKAGSLAEASLVLNGVFEAAQSASAQYIENIQRLSDEQDQIRAQKQAEADAVLVDAERRALALESETRKKCDEMIAAASQEAQAYWDNTYQRLERFCETKNELQGLLTRRVKEDETK